MSRTDSAELAELPEPALRRLVVDGIRAGAPVIGPTTVHIDITNACNAACVTCWDHSPLLRTPRPASWKKRQLAVTDFGRVVDQLAALGSVRAIVLSGMGDPLVHPGIYDMLALVHRHGWHTTVITNLVAADVQRLADSGVDQLLVGVHGATPRTYAAFHPGWTERQFATLCRALRVLRGAGIRCRHVHVINRDTANDVVDMVRFGHRFGADRVNYKLASLDGGTEDCAITAAQLDRLVTTSAEARTLASELGVSTNLDLFARQVGAARRDQRATAPIQDIGCFMGYLYTRITVDLEVLYCCNTEIQVGRLTDSDFASLWFGDRWQALRERLRSGHYFRGCDKCGKLEQNVKWSERYRAAAGEAAWRDAVGASTGAPPRLPRAARGLRVVD